MPPWSRSTPTGARRSPSCRVALQSTPDGDELVTAHLAEHQKVRNVRRDPRVAVTIVDPGRVGEVMRPYLAITGTARVVEGGAPELLKDLAQTLASPDAHFPPQNAPAGYVTRIRIDKGAASAPGRPEG